MKTLDDILARDRNNLDLVRLLAALAVLVGHAFELHPRGGLDDPVRWLVGFSYSGDVAVDVFFFLSGVLVTSSFCRSATLGRFVLLRLARLWPGLLLCLLLTVGVLGPLTSSLPLREYLLAWETRWYLLQNLAMQQMRFTLPGVFTDNLYPQAVNGALWTLPVELRCYAMVVVLGLLGAFKTPARCALAALAVAAVAVLANPAVAGALFTVTERSSLRLPMVFALGMVAYVWRQRVRIDWRVSVLALAATLLLQGTLAGVVAFYVAVLNSALVLAAAERLHLRLPADCSYGIYIYGFPVQQTVAQLLPQLNAAPSLLLSVPATVLLAALSWYAVERRGMAWGRRAAAWYEGKRAVLQQPAVP